MVIKCPTCGRGIFHWHRQCVLCEVNEVPLPEETS